MGGSAQLMRDSACICGGGVIAAKETEEKQLTRGTVGEMFA